MVAPILLLGAAGQIGWELCRVLAPLGPIEAPGRAQFDLSDEAQVRRHVRATRPALVVNAAAYTAVDKAEEEERTAMIVNGLAPGWLAEEAAVLGIPLVHYSSDYVFGGGPAPSRPHHETDPPAPVNAYGRTKLAGERAVAAVGGAHLIFRTSWVYGTRGRNFLVTIRRLASEQDELRVVNDQVGAPTWARLVAEATGQALAHAWRPGTTEPLSGRGGLYHLSAAGTTSWHGFAEAIVEALRQDGEPNLCVRRVTAVASTELPRPARRPRYSVLDNEAIFRAFAIRLPDWRSQLGLCLAR
ncbi:MAG: dTDP-4-dehydrorhamnose reductase [Alphaproteobacteria bacterium]